jgi:hypothetical protein
MQSNKQQYRYTVTGIKIPIHTEKKIDENKKEKEDDKKKDNKIKTQSKQGSFFNYV